MAVSATSSSSFTGTELSLRALRAIEDELVRFEVGTPPLVVVR
jgi:hypothetical protein